MSSALQSHFKLSTTVRRTPTAALRRPILHSTFSIFWLSTAAATAVDTTTFIRCHCEHRFDTEHTCFRSLPTHTLTRALRAQRKTHHFLHSHHVCFARANRKRAGVANVNYLNCSNSWRISSSSMNCFVAFRADFRTCCSNDL